MRAPTIIGNGDEVLIDTTTLTRPTVAMLSMFGVPLVKGSAWLVMDADTAARYGITPTANPLTGEPKNLRQAC